LSSSGRPRETRVEIDHPDVSEPLTPRILDDPEFTPALNDTPTVGQYGYDNGHYFEVVDTDGVEVQVKYDDGRTAWFQNNRFEQDGDGRVTLQ